MQQIERDVRAYFTITIADDAPDDLFTRGHDPEWADNLSGVMTEDDIIEHWAHNALANGVEDVSRLDGWADIPPWTVTLSVDSVEVE